MQWSPKTWKKIKQVYLCRGLKGLLGVLVFSFGVAVTRKNVCVCVCAKKQLKKWALLLKKKKIMIFNGIPAVTVLLDLGITC